MLPTFVEQNGQTYLNALKRYVLSGSIVPSQANGVIKCPAAVGSNVGMSIPTPLEGPQDSHTELHSLTGLQGCNNLGIGTISTAGTAVTGTGTKFLSQVTVGDTIFEPGGQSKTVQSISSDTSLTTSAGFAPDVTNVAFGITTPIVSDVQNRLRCMIQDVSYQRYLMNAPVPVLHIFGDNQKPGMFCERGLLQKNQVWRIQLFNPSTSGPGSLAPVAEGRKWQIEATEVYPDVDDLIKGLIARETMLSPYWLTLDQNDPTPTGMKTTIPAGGSVNAYMTNTGSNWLFLFFAFGHGISTGVAGETTEKFAYEIFDGRTNTPLQRQRVTLNTGLGTAQNPYRFPCPIVVEPRNQLRIKFDNLITDQSTDVFVTFGGVALLNPATNITDPVLMREAQRIYAATRPELMEASQEPAI